jgi:hypothetical protein
MIRFLVQIARWPSRVALLAAVLAAWPGLVFAQVGGVDLDTVRASRFDGGKMWTFEYAPAEYFSETYGVDANEAWFERARMAALRIPGCSASFVSPNGLLATNHHCVRSRVSAVSGPAEGLLDNGFYATSLAGERPIPGYYADQLIAIEDVTDEVYTAIDGVQDAGERERVRGDVFAGIQARLAERHASGSGSDSVWVQMIALYNGGRYSAYVFRRFTDIRLVMAVELEMGFFGGDPDNFTYPRYALDFAFLRAYGPDGQPYQTEHHFGWGVDGVEESDAVFVIGNPGPTNRLNTVTQLEFLRDVQVPAQRAWLSSRHGAMGAFREGHPAEAEALDIRNRMFSLSNSLKAAIGRLDALHSDLVMAKRRDAERALQQRIAERTELSAQYGDLFDRMAAVQQQKAELAEFYGAFFQLGHPVYGSQAMRRLLAAFRFAAARAGNASQDSLAELRDTVLSIGDHPPDLEQRLLAERFADIERYLGPDHEITQAILTDGTPAASAAALLAHSSLASSEDTRQAMEQGDPAPDDPGLVLIRALVPAYLEFRAAFARLLAEERELGSQLGRVRFDVYGRSVPPDATFSPRITDGVVMGYEYNGTLAPPYTTFYGVYDRAHSHAGKVDWALPARWRVPPSGLDLSTPLNFVSTADTYGGNSGSPAVTPDLALVGLNFDRNINGLSRDYVYLPEQGRNIMVDVRAIHASLDHVYDADRIVQELLTGRVFATEAEADADAIRERGEGRSRK